MAAAGEVPARPLAFPGHQWVCLEKCANGEGGRSGAVIPGWAPFSGPFEVAERVALEQKSNLRHCHGVVEGVAPAGSSGCPEGPGEPCGKHSALDGKQDNRRGGELAEESAGQGGGRRVTTPLYRVRLTDVGGGDVDFSARVVTAEARKLARVLPVDKKPSVLVMEDTTTFRRVAKTQVGHGDAVLEVGSALGDCTRVLSCHAAKVIGVDVSEKFVEESRRRLPTLHFEWLDFAQEPERLRSMCEALASAGNLKVFVDVGGDRAAADVCAVLADLFREIPAHRHPSLVVVKSRYLSRGMAEGGCDPDGRPLDLAAWWARAAAPPVPKSRLGEKRAQSRASRAMYANVATSGEGHGGAAVCPRGPLFGLWRLLFEPVRAILRRMLFEPLRAILAT